MPAGLGVVTQVSAGTEHTCALKNDGSLACWGWNDNGQTNVPAGLGGVTQVSAGGEHTCARKTDGTVACWGWNQDGQLNVPSIPSARINPTATFDAPTSVVAGQSFTLALNNAQVPGYTGSVTFTYAFDCGDGSGYGGFGPGVSVSCATSNAGSRTVRGTVKDDEGDATEYSATVEVTPAPGGGFSFSGFFAPLDNVAVNVARAGSAIPVKFSLGGDHGLAIFASGYPKFIFTPCPAAESEDPVDETTAAPRSGLSCADGQYTYAWKTEKSWAGKCGTLMLTFTDGTSHSGSSGSASSYLESPAPVRERGQGNSGNARPGQPLGRSREATGTHRACRLVTRHRGSRSNASPSSPRNRSDGSPVASAAMTTRGRPAASSSVRPASPPTLVPTSSRIGPSSLRNRSVQGRHRSSG